MVEGALCVADTSSPPTSASATKRFSPVSATAAPDQSSPVQEPGNTSEASMCSADLLL